MFLKILLIILLILSVFSAIAFILICINNKRVEKMFYDNEDNHHLK